MSLVPIVLAFLKVGICFKIKHFFADYPLQTSFHLKKGQLTGWVLPLMSHAAVHAAETFFITLLFLFKVPGGLVVALSLAAMDFVVHFTMDRIKASPNMLGMFKALSPNDFKYLKDLIDDNYTRLGQGGWDREMRNTFQHDIDDAERKMRGNTYFWWALGFDQCIHGLTDLVSTCVIVYFMFINL